MKTVVELDRDGNKESVFHRAGTTTVDGITKPDSRYNWIHPYEDRKTCEACINGNVPLWVKKEAGY